MVNVLLPKLFDSMTEATLVKWLKKENDKINVGDVLAKVESEKATLELESTDAGILGKILIPEGNKIKVGDTIAVITDRNEEIDKILKDVNPAEKSRYKDSEYLKLSNMRETIGKNMSASKSNAPHFYLTMEINMTQATSFRASINESQTDFKYSFNDFIIKAVGLALKKHKYLNGSFVDNHIILFKRIDVGVAVALDEGLITPVIRNCDQKSLKEIALDFRELAKRAKRKKLKPEEYKNSTFTISNLGMYGIEEFSAIINPPEAAILAVGEIKNQPVVENHEIVIGSTMKLTLSCDHRIVDGVTGSLFLREIKKSLENPTSLTS